MPSFPCRLLQRMQRSACFYRILHQMLRSRLRNRLKKFTLLSNLPNRQGLPQLQVQSIGQYRLLLDNTEPELYMHLWRARTLAQICQTRYTPCDNNDRAAVEPVDIDIAFPDLPYWAVMKAGYPALSPKEATTNCPAFQSHHALYMADESAGAGTGAQARRKIPVVLDAPLASQQHDEPVESECDSEPRPGPKKRQQNPPGVSWMVNNFL